MQFFRGFVAITTFTSLMSKIKVSLARNDATRKE